MNKFYVYVYLDTRFPGNYRYKNIDYIFDYLPFYIGKGEGNRLKKHLSESYNNRDENSHKCNVIRKIKLSTGDDPKIIKLHQNLSESESHEIETFYIQSIGRIDLKLGPLTNKTDGGEGNSGHILSTESKTKMINSLRVYYSKNKNKFSGKTHSKKTRKIMSEKRKKYCKENPHLLIKRVWTEEEKKEMSEKLKKSEKYKMYKLDSLKKYGLQSPHSEEYKLKGIKELRTFCEDRGLSFHSLIKYENSTVPNYIPGIGIGTDQRINTNGWSLTTH